MSHQQIRLLSVLCHYSNMLTFFVVPVVVPLVILAVTKNQIVKANARACVNLQLNLLIAAAIGLTVSYLAFGLAWSHFLYIWYVTCFSALAWAIYLLPLMIYGCLKNRDSETTATLSVDDGQFFCVFPISALLLLCTPIHGFAFIMFIFWSLAEPLIALLAVILNPTVPYPYWGVVRLLK